MDKEFRVKLGLSDQEFFRKYHAVKERVEKQEVKVPVSLEFDGERSAIDEAKKSVSGETIEIKARIKGLDREIKDAESSLEALQKYSNIDIANKKSAKEAKEAVERVNATIDEMAQKLQSLEGKGDRQGLIKYAKEVYQYLIAANEEVRKFNENTSGKRLEYFDDGSIADVVDEFEKSYKELNELSENFYKILDGEIKAPKIDTSGIDKAKARLKELSEEKRLLENELKSQPTIKADTEVNEGGLTEQLTKLKDKLTGVLNGLLIDTVSISPEAINVLRGKIESALDNIKVGIQNKDEINELLQKIIDIKGVDLSEGVGFSDDDNKLISESTKIVHKLGLELKKISEYIGEINITPIDIQYTNLDELNSVLDSINSEFKKVSDVLSKGIKVSKAKKASGEGIDSLIEKLNAQVDAFRLQFKEILDSFTIENINIDPEVLASLKNKIQDSFREIAISVDYLEPNTPEQIEKVTKIKSELNELNQLNNILDTIIEKVSKKNDLFVEEKDVVAKATKSELPKLGKLSDILEEVSRQLIDIRANGEAVDILPNLSTKLSELRELAESLESVSQRFNDIRVSGESFNALSNLSVNLSGTSNELAKTLLRISEANQWIRNNRSWSKTQNQTGELERAGYVNLKTGVVDNLEYYDRGDSFDGIKYIKDKIKNKYAVDKVGDIFDALLHTHPLQQGRQIKNIGRDGAFSGAIDENLEVTGDVGTFINELNEGVKKFVLLSDDLVTILDLSDLSLDKAKEVLRTYAEENNKIINERAGEWLNLTDANGKKYNDRNILTKLSDEAWKKTFSRSEISDNSIDGQSKKHIEHIELSDFVQRYGVNPSELADSIAKKANDAVQEAVNDAAANTELRNINLENNNNAKYSKSRDGFTTTDYQNLRYAFEANKDFDFGELGTGADVLKVIDNWGRLTQKDFSNFSELVEQIRQRNVEDGRNLNEVKQAYNYYKQRSDEIFKDINGNSVSGNEIAKILDTRKNGKNKDRWQIMPKEELDYILKQVNLVANAEEKVTKEAERQTKVHQSNAEKLNRQKEAAEKLRSYLNNIWAGKDNELENYDIQDILKNVSDGDWKEISENLSSKMKKALKGYNGNSVDPYNSTKKQRELFNGYSQNLAAMTGISDKISLSENKEDIVSLIQEWSKLEQQIKETWGAIQNNAPEVKLSKINTLLTRLTRELNSAGKAPKSLRVDAENLISELTTIRDRTVDAKEEWTDLSRVRLNDLQNQVNKIVVDLQEFKGKGFFDKIRASFTQASAQFIGYFLSLPDLTRYARQMYDVTREVDTAMIELKKVSNDTSSAVERSFSNMTKTAKDYGSSISNIISLTANWSRLGYNLPDSQELARVTQLYTNVGDGISSEQASESLISTLQGFKLSADSAEDIVDKFNEVGNNFAISSAGIGEALQRSAASFTAANTNLSQAIALVTATNEVVQDPDAVGTMWTTVSARIRGAKTELEEMGEDTEGVVTSTSKLRDLVKGIAGVDIMENETTFKDIYTIVDQIGHRWQDINDINQAALLEALAGKRQANRLVAVLNNVEGLESAYKAATNAAGSAEKEQSRYAESVNYSIERARANLQELITNILPTDAVKKVTDFGASALELLGKLTSGSNSLGRTLGAITGALSTFIPKLSGLQGFNIDLGNLEKSSGWIIDLGKGIKNLPEGLSKIKEGFGNLGKGLTFDGKEIVSDKSYEKLTEALNAYNASVDEKEKDSEKAILSAEELKEAYGEEGETIAELVQQNAGAKRSMDDLNVAAKSTTLRFKALSIASKALNTALNMLVGMGIGFLIQGIATAIDNVVHKAENTRKAAREVADEVDNLNKSLEDNKKLVSESGEEYLKLSKGVNDFGKNISLSKEDYSRYVELSKSMAETFPDLIKGYNDLNEPILKNVESLRELNAELDKQRIQTNNEIIYGKSEGNKGKSNFDVQADAFVNNYDASFGKMSEDERGIMDMIANDFDGFMELMSKYAEIQHELVGWGYDGDYIREEMERRGGKGLSALYKISANQENALSDDIAQFSRYVRDENYQAAIKAQKEGIELSVEQQNAINEVRAAQKAFLGESDQIKAKNQEYLDQMRTQLGAYVNISDGYNKLTEEQRSYVLTLANNVSGEWFHDILSDDKDNNTQFVAFANSLVKAINSDDPKVQEAFKGLFDLDEQTKDFTYDQYKNFVDGIIQTIVDRFGEDSELVNIFRSLLGYVPTRQEVFDVTKGNISEHLENAEGATSDLTTRTTDSGYSYSLRATNADKFVTALEGMSKADYDFVSGGLLSDEAWNEFNAKVKEAGGLVALEVSEIQDLISEAIKETSGELEENVKTTGSTFIETLQSQMAPAMNALGEAYNAIFNGGENGDEFNMAAVTMEQLNAVTSAVKSLTSNEEWGISIDTADLDNLINILGNVNTTADEAQEAFDDFATSIANAVIPNIENLTEASYQAGIQALQEMGIVNAEEVLISRIGLSLEDFKRAKEEANAVGINTDGDIQNLSDLNKVDLAAQNELAKLIAEKIRVNGIAIQTNGDIANLISLAKAAYGTAGALAEVYSEIDRLNSKGDNATNQYEREYWYAKANSLRENFNSPAWVQARMNELYQGAQVSVDFDGGNAANSAGSSGGGGGSDSDTKDEFSEEIDWIERRQKALSDALTDIQGVVDFTYADWDARLAHIGMKYQNLTDQITLSQQAMERYQRAMAEVGLDEDYAAKVRAGIIDLETITDEALKGQIDSYQGYYDKFVQYEQQFNDLTRQHIALIQDEVDQLRSRFEDIDEDLAHLNTLSDSSINRGTIYQQLGSLLDKRVHTEMQLENVLKEREAIEAKIAQYQGDTNSEGYHDLIRNLQECDEKAEGFRDTLQEIAKARFDTVAEQFDRIAESIDHATSRINSLADTAEAQGFYASDEFIKANLAMEEDRRSNLYKERAELEKALAEGVANGSITEGSNTWNEMNEKIEETTDNIYASTAAIEKYKDELRSWQWEAQDWIRERANRAHDTNDFMIEQLGTDKLFEKNGNWNDSATATQGLHVLNYSMYLDESRKLAEEIKKIDEEMANDPYDVQLIARKEELIDLQREAIRNANDEKEAIRSLVKEGYDTFLNYLQKAIDKRKEALEAEQTLYEYEKNVRDQAKQIASYQKQLASLSGDTSEENQLRVQQLNNSLAEAQEQLQETQYEKWVSDQEQMMDEMYNQFDELINERLDNLDRLVQDAVNTTDQNGTKIANTVSQKADSIGVDIRDGFGGIDYDLALSGIDGDIQTQTSTLNETLETQGQAIIKAAQDAALSIKGEMTKPGTDDTNYARDDSGLKDVVSDTPASKNTPTLANGAMAYRLYNPNSGQHLITTNASEAEGLVKLGWNREGETLFSPNEGKPVTRLYNPNNGDHLYTTNSGEIKTLKALGWNDEGEAFKTSDDGVDVYRLYNPNNGLHHFTTSEEERDHLRSLGWNYEGVAFRSVGKFAKGGTVGKAVKGTGEDGFILARTGEEVLSLDKIKGMQQVLTMFEPLTKLQQKMPNGISTLGGNNVTIGDVTTTLSLPNVTNYEDFVNKAKADPKFERLVQQMTIGNALGQSKLKKYSI